MRRSIDLRAGKVKGINLAKYLYSAVNEMNIGVLADLLSTLGAGIAARDLRRMIKSVFRSDTGITFTKLVDLYSGTTKIKLIQSLLKAYSRPTLTYDTMASKIRKWWHDVDPVNFGEVQMRVLAKKLHHLGFTNTLTEATTALNGDGSAVIGEFGIWEFFDAALLRFILKGIYTKIFSGGPAAP